VRIQHRLGGHIIGSTPLALRTIVLNNEIIAAAENGMAIKFQHSQLPVLVKSPGGPHWTCMQLHLDGDTTTSSWSHIVGLILTERSNSPGFLANITRPSWVCPWDWERKSPQSPNNYCHQAQCAPLEGANCHGPSKVSTTFPI
jgi:hypothetical protein